MAEERPPFPPLLAGRWVPSLHDEDIAALVGTYERDRARLAARPPGLAPGTAGPFAGRDPTAESMLGTLAVLHVLASSTFERLCRVTLLLGPALHEFRGRSGTPGGERERVAEPPVTAHRDLVALGERRSRLKIAEHATGFLVRAGGGARAPRPDSYCGPTATATGPAERRRPSSRARNLRRRLDGLELALDATLGAGLTTFLATSTGWAERYATIIDEINACHVAVRAYTRGQPGEVVAGPVTG